MPSVCPGCSASFTASGLGKHLSQTKNPACINVRRGQAHQSLPPPSQSDPQPSGLPFAQDFDLDGPPVIFEGDFFGDYTEQDFEDVPPDSSSSSSDDEVGISGGVGAWEPPVQTPPPGPMPPVPIEEPVHPPLPLPSVRGRVEQGVRRKTHVVPFPSNAAGAPIPLSSSGPARNASSQSYECYQSYITPDQPSLNPYAPFVSRLDWEVARWAKLRGSGSTAFSDLLAIEDVRLS